MKRLWRRTSFPWPPLGQTLLSLTLTTTQTGEISLCLLWSGNYIAVCVLVIMRQWGRSSVIMRCQDATSRSTRSVRKATSWSRNLTWNSIRVRTNPTGLSQLLYRCCVLCRCSALWPSQAQLSGAVGETWADVLYPITSSCGPPGMATAQWTSVQSPYPSCGEGRVPEYAWAWSLATSTLHL